MSKAAMRAALIVRGPRPGLGGDGQLQAAQDHRLRDRGVPRPEGQLYKRHPRDP